MDLSKNRIPESVKTVHFIAVCGSAMGALACMMKDMGYEVTGSDLNVYPPMSDYLREKGIKMNRGFGKENLSHNPDLVVVGNAVTRENVEAVETKEKGLFFCSMPQAVNHFVAGGKDIILITGTHGKTTTSSLMAWILMSAGLDPSFFIGGIMRGVNSNYRVGKDGGHIVIEGDEYDTAFFDKKAKFFHYPPKKAVLTSMEYDHADIYKNFDQIKEAFSDFIRIIPGESELFVFDGDNSIPEVLGNHKCGVFTYGDKKDSFFSIKDVKVKESRAYFKVMKKGALYGEFKTVLMGEHNLFNLLSCIAMADGLGISKEALARAMESFPGVKRRQEIRGVKKGVTVMDDFAHHPTAVRETIKGVRPFFSEGRIIAVFEPRTNTSMRAVFQDVYPDSFDGADMICIRKPSMLKKIPQGERFSSEQLVRDLNDRGKAAIHFPDTDGIIDYLEKEAKKGDLILVMSNGGFDSIHERLLKRL